MLLNRVNAKFARVNERRGVNEISVPNFLHPLVTCICLVFVTKSSLMLISYRGGHGCGVPEATPAGSCVFSDPESKICEKSDPDTESLFIFGSSRSLCGLHKCHCWISVGSMVAGVWAGVGFSNLKKFWTRIQTFWNRSGFGVWKSGFGVYFHLWSLVNRCLKICTNRTKLCF